MACGAAHAFKSRGEPRVAVPFFGDGAMNQGVVLEALNLAVILSLPVIFVCENNGYAITSPIGEMSRGGLTRRAAGFGLPAERVDGMDVRAVHRATAAAVARHPGVRGTAEAAPGCPEELEIAAFAEGTLDRARGQRLLAHMGDCDRCLELLDAALAELRGPQREASGTSIATEPWPPDEMAPDEMVVESPRSAANFLAGHDRGCVEPSGTNGWPPLRLSAWRPVFAVAAVVVLILLWQTRSVRIALPPTAGTGDLASATPDWAAFARVESLPVRHARDAVDPDSAQDILRIGLAAYEVRDWARAAASFEREVRAMLLLVGLSSPT